MVKSNSPNVPKLLDQVPHILVEANVMGLLFKYQNFTTLWGKNTLGVI